MKETIRVAFFDIDGTLASHKVESSNFLDRVPASRAGPCARSGRTAYSPSL